MIHYNTEKQLDGQPPIAFPIRGIDYDPERRWLFTGDEIGCLATWDVSKLLDKMDQVMADYRQRQPGMQEKDSTFITGSSGENWEKIKFSADDVKLINHFSAHTDAISWVTWVPELRVVATSSFDKNVYMWSTDFERSDEGKKMGLLVLGNKATAKDAEVDKETQKYRDKWLISVDKETRY